MTMQQLLVLGRAVEDGRYIENKVGEQVGTFVLAIVEKVAKKEDKEVT